MITGLQAFGRDTLAATLAAVLEEDPPPAGEFVAGLPDKLSPIIQKCLSKDRSSRFQAIDDVRLALDDLEKDTNPSGSVESARDEVRPVPLPPPLRRSRSWAAAILITIIALSAGWWWSTRGYSKRSETQLKVVPLTTGAGVERNPSFSPDGTQIVYEWVKEDGQRHLYPRLAASNERSPRSRLLRQIRYYGSSTGD
jgi:hypothetical protein